MENLNKNYGSVYIKMYTGQALTEKIEQFKALFPLDTKFTVEYSKQLREYGAYVSVFGNNDICHDIIVQYGKQRKSNNAKAVMLAIISIILILACFAFIIYYVYHIAQPPMTPEEQQAAWNAYQYR